MLFLLNGCLYVSLEKPTIPNYVAAEQAPNVDNATESAKYFHKEIDKYLKNPQLVKDFAKYNLDAWNSLNRLYNPSSTEVSTK